MTNKPNPEIELIPLTGDDLEIVRQWRNSEPVRKQMEFQEEITPEMQREWFESMSAGHNYYAVIVYKGKKIGVSNIKNLDDTGKTGESGIFIADPDCLDTTVPVQVSLYGTDFCFEELGMERIYAKIAGDNVKARRLVTALGYEPVDEATPGRFRHYVLTKESYYKHREHLMDLLYGTE